MGILATNSTQATTCHMMFNHVWSVCTYKSEYRFYICFRPFMYVTLLLELLMGKIVHYFSSPSTTFHWSLYSCTFNECPLRYGNNTWTKWPSFCRRHFHVYVWMGIFIKQNFVFYSSFTKLCYWGCNWQHISIGSGNGLALTRRQGTTSINVD